MDQGAHRLMRAQEPLRAAALEREFAGDLLPALTLIADQPLGRHEHAIEDDLVEIVLAGEVADRPHREARRLQVEDQLREAGVAVRPTARGAYPGGSRMRFIPVTGPLPGARHPPTALGPGCSGSARRQV